MSRGFSNSSVGRHGALMDRDRRVARAWHKPSATASGAVVATLGSDAEGACLAGICAALPSSAVRWLNENDPARVTLPVEDGLPDAARVGLPTRAGAKSRRCATSCFKHVVAPGRSTLAWSNETSRSMAVPNRIALRGDRSQRARGIRQRLAMAAQSASLNHSTKPAEFVSSARSFAVRNRDGSFDQTVPLSAGIAVAWFNTRP